MCPKYIFWMKRRFRKNLSEAPTWLRNKASKRAHICDISGKCRKNYCFVTDKSIWNFINISGPRNIFPLVMVIEGVDWYLISRCTNGFLRGSIMCRNLIIGAPVIRNGCFKNSPVISVIICIIHTPGKTGCPGKCPLKMACSGLSSTTTWIWFSDSVSDSII